MRWPALLPPLSLGLWLAFAPSALAHASFVRSEPPDICGPLAVPRVPPGDPRCRTGLVLAQAPAVVRITFSEPVQLLGRGIRVLSPSGRPVQGKPAVDGELASVPVAAAEPGTYVVQWQVLSADTHPLRGQFAFSVGYATAPPVLGGGEVGQVAPLGLALQAVARWLHFAGYALAFGTVGVALALWRSTGAISAPWRLMNAGIILLLLSEPVALLGQTGSLGADQLFDGDALGDTLASPFGRLLGFRVAAALLLWVVGGSFEPEPGRQPPGGGSALEPSEEDDYFAAGTRLAINHRLAIASAAGLGVGLALIDGLGQHAGSFRPEWLGLVVHGLHLMAMAVWLGGLAAALAGRRLGDALPAGKLLMFGPLGGVALTGAIMAFVHVPSPGAVLGTPYGQVLAGKQVALAMALAAGWLAARSFRKRRLWAAELALLTVVIGLAGLLVSLPPPR